ncbi:MAG: rod shape-determining protein MreC [Nitrospirae bacterium]|nr:rod shape-determining protein MreC [Nitrospirota bacterium]
MSRKSILLFLFVILVIGLMTYQSKSKHLLPFQFLNNPITKLHDGLSSLKDSLKTPFKRMLLREKENIRLKTEIDKLMIERQNFKEVLLENKRLKELLLLKDKTPNYITIARVIARGPDQWSNTFVLDKGSSAGIKKDMVAITAKGLVGKISEVSNSYSNLLLITDINFFAAVRVQEGRQEGIISGTGLRRCQLKYIPYDEDVKKGDILITSGLDNLFTKGIPVGYVSKVDKTGSGLFQNIEVVPFADNRKIEEVIIISR